MVYILDCNVLKEKQLFCELYQKMPAYRKEKISAYRFESDKRLSLGAGILLSYALQTQCLQDVALGQNGKPYIPHSSVHFNISHSGNIAMLAVSENPIGCDVERIKPINTTAIAKRFFNDSEYSILQNADTEQNKLELFYRLWTLKESFMKATGLGMSLPLNAFCIGFENDTPYVQQTVNDKEYSFKEYESELPYRFAVCAEGKADFENNIQTVDISSEGFKI